MTHLRNLRARSVLQWVSFNLSHGSKSNKLYSSRALKTLELEASCDNNGVRVSKAAKKVAQEALLDYFQSTRNLPYLEAENMSQNAPVFTSKLLKMVDRKADIGSSVSRFLCYNPVNEFEPFLESLGLKPSEYVPLLPRDLVFLSDARSVLDNYHKLRDYGFKRTIIGKIYVGATEVFFSDVSVLVSKLRAYENLGIGRSALVKFIGCSPYLLVKDVDSDFVRVLEKLNGFGLENSWIEGNLSEGDSRNWTQVLGILRLFSEMGLSDDQIFAIISRNPNILFEESGYMTVLLVGFLLKFGSEVDEISSVLVNFPPIRVGKFVSNLRRCVSILNEIDMEKAEIGGYIRANAKLIGFCTLMKANSLRKHLSIGKKRLCSYISENPQELKNLVLGAKVNPLSKVNSPTVQKNKFLLDLGYEEGSDAMKKAQSLFRGKGDELQERFDFIMSYGLTRDEVSEMVKVSPQILNQKKNVLRTKIDLLVKELGNPISALRIYPSCLNYTVERVKVRFAMYVWLVGQGFAEPKLALSSILACTDETFLKQFVNRHQNGPKIWQDLQKN